MIKFVKKVEILNKNPNFALIVDTKIFDPVIIQ